MRSALHLFCTGRMGLPILVALALCAIQVLARAETRTDESTPVDFKEQVAPILSEHCLGCHSPNIKKGDLSLATRVEAIDDGYLVEGDPEASRLLEVLVATEGERPEMPMEGEPLSDQQVETIRKWIEQGANWPDGVVLKEKSKADGTWWSLQPLQRDSDSLTIDGFVQSRLDGQGLRLNSPADRRSLIRRVTYGLTGLPPTPAEVMEFEAYQGEDAYEKVVERLLASPAYGEHWGRHWLDVVRFGESNGFERNVIINELWPFRDYVIESLNEDKPFDQLIREHLAGDVLAEDDPQQAIGTAFLVAGPYDDVNNQDVVQAAQIRANTLDEMVRATSEAFIGLTVGCARCHDHKFDAITQEDYYSLHATFAGVKHGAITLAKNSDRQARAAKLEKLQNRKSDIDSELGALQATILERAKAKLEEISKRWGRPPVDRTGTEEHFEPVTAKWIRLVCKAQDSNPNAVTDFRIDEFEVWSDAGSEGPTNVALAANGARATGRARTIEDFEDAYGPQLAIDGEFGARFISKDPTLTIELAEPARINRVLFSSGRGEKKAETHMFTFVAEYSIEISDDGVHWTEVANGDDRKPVDRPGVLDRRLLQLESTNEEDDRRRELTVELAKANRQIAAVPALPRVWIGNRDAEEAKGPFHIFVGGSPQRKGDPVQLASLRSLGKLNAKYELPSTAEEGERRAALADWIVSPENPLTPRVLVNRIWHYHFGTGIVDTPNDFGYMGGKPTHPDLLDFLAVQLLENGWKIKDLHRQILLSKTYRQSSAFIEDAAKIDADARLLWRFPPRRLSAEEIRDTVLAVCGQLDRRRGGPGFRLYQYMQDNVSTYAPLDQHGSDTYRRAVYHQNVRASVVDLMTEFDQPDCAFSAPRRAQTTTPLQALTMLNHSFTVDMANALAKRLAVEAGASIDEQLIAAFQECFARDPTNEELAECRKLTESHGLAATCRVLLNASELIYVQ